jgi:hypothetical protein
MNEQTVTVTQADIRKAFLQWEIERRAGQCQPPERADTLTPEQIADENAEHFWPRLFG